MCCPSSATGSLDHDARLGKQQEIGRRAFARAIKAWNDFAEPLALDVPIDGCHHDANELMQLKGIADVQVQVQVEGRMPLLQ